MITGAVNLIIFTLINTTNKQNDGTLRQHYNFVVARLVFVIVVNLLSYNASAHTAACYRHAQSRALAVEV